MNPLISVVMSVFNADKYLDEAIQSILNQTYKNFEFIIINDGSTDRSLDIIEKYKKNDKRIILINRENKGLIYSLNEGISIANGKYIARMDADDISLPTRFEKQIEFMENNPEIGVCGTAVIGFNGEKEKVWRLATNSNFLKAELLFSSCFAHPTVMMRKELIEKYDLFYNKNFIHAEDFELWTRMTDYCEFANLKEPLLKYRVSNNNITKKADKNIAERYRILKMIFKRNLEKLGINNSEEEYKLHFALSVNHRMKNANISFEKLKKYFNKLIIANNNKKIFNDFSLKKVLGKRWLWNFYYRRDFLAIFSKYFLYGLLGLKK